MKQTVQEMSKKRNSEQRRFDTTIPTKKKRHKGNERSPVQKRIGQMLEEFPPFPQVFGFVSPFTSVEDLVDL